MLIRTDNQFVFKQRRQFLTTLMSRLSRFTVLYVLLFGLCLAANAQVDLGDPQIGLVVDQDRTQANGIRAIDGKFITILTDLPQGKEIEVLPEVFDQAVLQWMAFFRVSATEVKDFRATGFVIKDKAKFERANLFPRGLPQFKNGYTYGKKTFWMFDQPSDFMRRQLLLHEGTHAFIFSHLGDKIPPWFNEGLAELFGCHLWKEKKLTTCITVADRESAPFWGRTKAIGDLAASGQTLTISEVMKLDNNSFLQVDPYAWVWAYSAFLYHHPDFSDNFRKLARAVAKEGQVEIEFKRFFGAKLSEMEEDWKAYIKELDYKIESSQTKIHHKPAPLHAQGIPKISANKSWQNSGIQVDAGGKYLVRSKGRFTIRVAKPRTNIGSAATGKKSVAWPCEPNGITVEYYRGRPIGQLVAVVKPNAGPIDFESIITIGLSKKFTAKQAGTLYFRVNESPAEFEDNEGEILISVKQN